MFEAGFEIFEGVLSEAECDRLIAHLSIDDSRAGVRHLMNDPEVIRLASDKRLASITEHLLGFTLVPYKATLFQKTGKANWLVSWHQDTALPVESLPFAPGWGPSSMKDGVLFAHAPTSVFSGIVALRIHLDASTHQNGPLRVIPGSHRKRLIDDDLRRWIERKSVECRVGKGGVIAMSPLVIHASSKCTSDEPRRVLHIEYAAKIEIENGIKLKVA